jgi:hypothetical protein
MNWQRYVERLFPFRIAIAAGIFLSGFIIGGIWSPPPTCNDGFQPTVPLDETLPGPCFMHNGFASDWFVPVLMAIATLLAIGSWMFLALAETKRREALGQEPPVPFLFQGLFGDDVQASGPAERPPTDEATPPPKQEPNPKPAGIRPLVILGGISGIVVVIRYFFAHH